MAASSASPLKKRLRQLTNENRKPTATLGSERTDGIMSRERLEKTWDAGSANYMVRKYGTISPYGKEGTRSRVAMPRHEKSIEAKHETVETTTQL